MKIKSIFEKKRCQKCDNLILRSGRDHKCNEEKTKFKFPRSRRLNLEVYMAFEELSQKSLRPSDIMRYLKKRFPDREYTHDDINQNMKNMPETYAVDTTIKQSKHAEKYYLCLFTCSTKKRKKIEQDRIIGYHIQPPRSKWGLTHSIKKITMIGMSKKETTLAIVYGKDLAEILLKKCKELKA